MQNSDFRIRNTSLYWSQTSPMVFCIQNSDFSTRIASLYVPQTSPVVVCVQNIVISIRNTSLYGSQPSSVVFACKTATLAPELQFSMDPSPHLWFLHVKQRLLDQNYKSPRVPDPTCRFCMQNSVISTRITSLYGSQTSPTVFLHTKQRL